MPASDLLVDLIASYPPSMTDAEVFAALSAASESKTDSTLYSFRHLVLALGEDLTRSVLAKLEAASGADPILKATYNAICNAGINFADAATQSAIDRLASDTTPAPARFTAEEATAMKAIGIRSASKLELAGLSGVTEAEIASVRAENYRLAVMEKIRFAYNTSIEKAERGQISWAEFQALVAGM